MPYIKKIAAAVLPLICALFFACDSDTTEPPAQSGVTPPSSAGDISYANSIQPILDTKCVACHACYDAPCQLILTSATGLRRGASKKPVYDSLRLEAASPTRLHIDATTTEAWREKNFYSVIDDVNSQKGVFIKLLRHGKNYPGGDNKRLSDNIEIGTNQTMDCPVADEVDDFIASHPHSGMPYGVTGLTDSELKTISDWIAAGAATDVADPQLTKAELNRIEIWEDYFNGATDQQRLVSRYLYEHLFIAHLYFNDLNQQRFYRLVRSSTPPGETIQPVATTRPNEDPGQPFWYRLQIITDTIVYKTHITYALKPEKLERFTQLFGGNWTVDEMPGYEMQWRKNPFLTFRAIPARSRYQFMLDDAAYFVRTFIRGPVCHGQIATDVIQDHFWNLFQSPDTDLYITNADYRDSVTPLLGLPGVDDDLQDFAAEWLKYRQANSEYLEKRDAIYSQLQPRGFSIQHIWDGDTGKPDALQTIFRHHNNAAIQTGLLGATPKTIWVMDYALFERSYYVLVANFNVFGNLPHQTLTRLYFDLIRNGAEQNFLRFMPAEKRQAMIENWYRDMGELKLYLSYQDIDTETPVDIPYVDEKPKEQFKHLVLDSTTVNIDTSSNAKNFPGIDALLDKISARNRMSLPVVRFMPDISFLRIYDTEDQQTVYSLVRDREHTNVAFMIGESLRYDQDKDHLTVHPGILGSYPNFMFNVSAEEVEDFVHFMLSIVDEEQFVELIDRWGVRRSHPEFWQLFHKPTEYLQRHNPAEAGIFDMNRYLNL